MKKSLLILLIVAIAACLTFYIWTAISARRKSNEIISKFQEIDRNLASSTDSLIAKGGIGAVQEVYLNAEMKSQLILLIDSLKEMYEISSEKLNQAKSAKELRLDIKRLLSYIQNYNQLKKNEADPQMPDTIMYNSGLGKFTVQKWQSDYFEGVPKEVSLTYLNFIRNKLIKNN